MKEQKVIGILGGMGSYATVDVFEKVLRATPAKRDQDHIRIIIDNNPKIPNRRTAILDGTEDPTPIMIETAKNLERAGADFIILPCNTAHYFIPEIQKNISVPIISMIDETVNQVCNIITNVNKVGLLASLGTLKVKLYHNAFEIKGVNVIIPEEDDQNNIIRIIDKVKVGANTVEDKNEMKEIAFKLVSKGVEGIVLGCTEIPIVIGKNDIGVPIFDATKILATSAVKMVLEG